jgi:hypothetical protein
MEAEVTTGYTAVPDMTESLAERDGMRSSPTTRAGRIDCGSGRDTVWADDVDVIARNCELVIRSR